MLPGLHGVGPVGDEAAVTGGVGLQEELSAAGGELNLAEVVLLLLLVEVKLVENGWEELGGLRKCFVNGIFDVHFLILRIKNVGRCNKFLMEEVGGVEGAEEFFGGLVRHGVENEVVGAEDAHGEGLFSRIHAHVGLVEDFFVATGEAKARYGAWGALEIFSSDVSNLLSSNPGGKF